MEDHIWRAEDRFSGSMVGKTLRIIGWVIVGMAFLAFFALVFGFLVKWIWNMLMPSLFGLREITYWQAFGIVILAKLIFGGFGPHRHDHWPGERKSFRDWAPPWRRAGESRETFKAKYRNWKHYHQFWRDEGKAAFEAYVERLERAKKEDQGGEACQEE